MRICFADFTAASVFIKQSLVFGSHRVRQLNVRVLKASLACDGLLDIKTRIILGGHASSSLHDVNKNIGERRAARCPGCCSHRKRRGSSPSHLVAVSSDLFASSLVESEVNPAEGAPSCPDTCKKASAAS